jgi:hypothetical protein
MDDVEQTNQQLTSDFKIFGGVMAPGTLLTISKRRQMRGQVELTLTAGQTTLSCEVSVLWAGMIDNTNHCIVSYPPMDTPDDDDLVVLEIVDEDHLRVISPEHFRARRLEIAQASVARGRVFSPDLEAVLGSVPSE